MDTDRSDLPITADEPDAIDAVEHFAQQVLSHGRKAAEILEAAERHPAVPMVQAYAAALFLFLQTGEGTARARPYLTRARAGLERRATDRERMTVAALEAWADGDIDRTLARQIEIAKAWPRDLLNVKIAQIHQLNRGDRQGMRGLAECVLPANRERSHAWGLLAFALEQSGEPMRAELCGRRAVSMNPDDPWAHHAVAHALASQGRTQAGVAWLEGLSDRWDRCSSFMYTHNWWHMALFHIDLDAPELALRLFDERIWGVRKSCVQDQINAVALLARLELRGIDAGDRWADVAHHVAPRINDHLNGFADLHFIYALARAGDDVGVQQMLDGLAAATATDGGRPSWHSVALKAARGMVAHARGRFDEALANLKPVRALLPTLGGSTAQQDLFEQIYLDALVGGGRLVEARRLYADRIARRGGAGWERRGYQRLSGQAHRAPANRPALAAIPA